MPSETDTGPVDVSVVVPVYNDPDGIRVTLDAVTRQTYPDDAFEVLPVDNGSTDGTRAVIRSFEDRYPGLVHLVTEDDVQGSYAARNRGVERSVGEIVAFVDADVTVGRTWLASIVDAMDAAGGDYLGCAVRTVTGEPETTLEAYNRQTAFPVERYLNEQHFAPTCGLAVRREVFYDVGLFDERLCSSGDAEFGRRVHDAGYVQHYAPDIVVHHPPRSAIELVRKQFRIGRGFAQRRRYHADMFEHRPLMDPRLILPTLSPTQLRSSAREVTERSDASLGFRNLVSFYVLDYLGGLSRVAGRAAERLTGWARAGSPECGGWEPGRDMDTGTGEKPGRGIPSLEDADLN